MRTGTVYFIEDMDTHRWYVNSLLLQLPSLHTFGKGWDYPDPAPEDWWTDDPIRALQFDKKIMDEVLQSGMVMLGERSPKNLEFFDWEKGVMKNLRVVEYTYPE